MGSKIIVKLKRIIQVGQTSSNPNFSVIFSDIHKVPVHVTKLKTRQFQNTPSLTLEFYSNMNVLWPSKTKLDLLLEFLSKKCAFWLDFNVNFSSLPELVRKETVTHLFIQIFIVILKGKYVTPRLGAISCKTSQKDVC